ETGAAPGDCFTITSLMRALVGLVVAMAVLASITDADADTRTRHRPTKHDDARSKKRAARLRALRERERIEPRQIAHGQSVGAPWAGHLQHATALPPGDGYFLRRPERAFGTQTTVDLTLRAIVETLDAFPDEHVLAI